MNSVNKLNKLADSFEKKINKFAEYQQESSERGVHATILFGDEPGDKSQRFIDSLSGIVSKILPDYAVKYNTGISVKLYPDISVGSTPDSGKILPGAEIELTNDAGGKNTAALTSLLKGKLESTYKGLSGKTFSSRAQELNSKGKFPTNANKVSPELMVDLSVGSPS